MACCKTETSLGSPEKKIPESLINSDGDKMFLLQNRRVMDAANAPANNKNRTKKGAASTSGENNADTTTISTADFHVIHAKDLKPSPKKKKNWKDEWVVVEDAGDEEDA